MKKIKLTMLNGDILITTVNLSEDEVFSYYTGKKYCLLDEYDDTDILTEVVRIEFLN